MPAQTWKPDRARLAEPIYEGIVKALAEDIERGRLRAGDPLPTQRALSAALRVSLGTVTRAYNEAVERGLVKGEVGRGTFVAGTPAAALEEIGRHAPGEGMIDLSANYPLYPLDPDLAAGLARLSRRRDLQPLLQYQVPAGGPRHRDAAARWIRECGVEASPATSFICAGAQNALVAVLGSVAAPGDVVLAEELTYPGIKAVAGFLRLRLQGLPMDDAGILPEAFEAAARQRKAKALYCIPTLQNPTGAVMPASRRRKIAKIAERHGLAIVEDDIYRPLLDDPPPPIATFLPRSTYYVASLSKVLAGGLRVAFLSTPDQGAERVSQALWATQWMVAPLMAELAVSWIEDGTAARTLALKRREAEARQGILRRALSGFPVKAHPRALHAWLELPEGWTSAGFTLQARARGVGVTPGSAFSVAADRDSAAGVRICAGAADSQEDLRRALGVLAGLLRSPRRLGPALV